MTKNKANKKLPKNKKTHKKSILKSQAFRYAAIAIVCTALGATASIVALRIIDGGNDRENKEQTQQASIEDNLEINEDKKENEVVAPKNDTTNTNNKPAKTDSSSQQKQGSNTKQQPDNTKQQSPKKQEASTKPSQQTQQSRPSQSTQPAQLTKPETGYPSSGTFGYGGKFEIRGVRYQIGSTTSFHTIHARYSDYDGRTAFCLPLTLTNNTSELKKNDYIGWKSYKPNGESINPYANDLLSNEIKTYGNDILPGNSINKYYCALYYGSGRYTIAIPGNSQSVLDIFVKINIGQ